jgi:hypothetical protein
VKLGAQSRAPAALLVLLLLALGGSGQTADGDWPQGSPPAAAVDGVDVSAAGKNLRLSLTMLQGLANRGPRARVYLIHPGPSDAFWLKHPTGARPGSEQDLRLLRVHRVG